MDYAILLEKAKEVSENAYATHTKFSVGACILTKSGKTYSGCNFESLSNIMTICAERSAILNAVSNADTDIVAVAIYASKMENCLPCGVCRQIIYEFKKDEDIDIITQVGDGYKVYKITELLPLGFELK